MKSQWGIRLPNGDFLDTPPDFSIQFEFNNQVFSTGDASILPGSFSFPVTVALTPRMRQQLAHPDRIDNAVYFTQIAGVWACIDGNPLFQGTLKIDSTDTSGKVSLTIIINPLSASKKIDLDALELGGDRTLSPYSTWADLMFATANTPEAFDFLFFPVFGGEFKHYTDFPTAPFDTWFLQNYWNTATGAFTNDSDGIYTPFVKVNYLIDRIFANIGNEYAFSNAWQSTTELQRLCLYNNVDLRQFETGDTAPALPATFKLNRHVPKIAVTEFLKKIAAQWCLGLFTNHFKQTFRLVPLADVLGAASRWDWTEYTSGALKIEQPDNFPANLNYSNSEELPAGMPKAHEVPHFATYIDYLNNPPASDVRYVYIEAYTMLLDRVANIDPVKQLQVHRGYVTDIQGETFDPGISALHCIDIFNVSLYESTAYLSRWEEGDTSSGFGTAWSLSEVEYPLALMLYRGIQNLQTGSPEFPMAFNHPWRDRTGGGDGSVVNIVTDGVVEAPAAASLNWQGEYGLYNRAWKQWHTMLRQGKHVTQVFNIPIAIFREFSFEDKIRVGNMDFFLKRMRVQKLLANGTVQIETTMVSVI